MNAPRRSGPPSPKQGAGGRTWRPSVAYLAIAIALALVAGGLVFLLLSSPEDPADLAARMAAQPSSASGMASWPPPMPVTPITSAQDMSKTLPEGDADPTRDLSSYVMRGENPTMPEVIERLHQAGIHSGLGAFSLPGTRPPMIGLAVPEDFVLPAGYVRHHQATDDGQRIEAILMFAPDHQFFDANKQPVVIPANRVVPAELAPPGFPIRHIVIPAPVEQQKSGH
ncbi:hypothetical protein ACO0K3_16640 [Undibacterium sp. Rencai35W]|uniref:hypothetical protein n=1 Tax=Undibacterium sp. Rencai35W TaxID=3413046 RepID=UPI003BF0C899